jgi:UDP-N-acetylmuramate dehydrogenase
MIKHDYCLENQNTLQTKTVVDEFYEFETISDLECFFKDLEYSDSRYMALGGGSNILFTKDFNGSILHSINNNVLIEAEDCNECLVRAFAGLKWDRLVSYSLDNNLKGIEALSLIPGSVGAAPVQNIGAYGTEVSDYIDSVECYDALAKRAVILKHADCKFSYRNSVFKERPELFVVSVVFKLYKTEKSHYEFLYGQKLSAFHLLKCCAFLVYLGMKSLRFGSHTNWRLKMNFDNVRDMLGLPVIPAGIKRLMVIFIRKRNMPNPNIIANCGCFFKSPVVLKSDLESLALDSSIAIYQYDKKNVKVSAGDLIKFCGLHGHIVNGVGLDPNRPLILINYDKASGEEIFKFSQRIIIAVHDKTGVMIEPEVVIV